MFYSLTRLKAWVFLIPFSICWYGVFKHIRHGVSEILQSQEGIMITSAIYGTDGALNLFVDHPPSLSLFYLITLSAMPFFAVLASYDLYSSDLSSGFFRFLITRCRRIEIFLARIIGTVLLMASALLVVTTICTVFSIQNDNSGSAETIQYAIQVYLSSVLYAIPFIAYMSLISSLVSSTVASLFLGFMGFAAIWILNLFTFFTQQKDFFSYLLASGFKEYLFELDTADFYTGIMLLPLYSLIYMILAYQLFSKRNL